MSIKIVKFPPVNGGPFLQGDTIEYTIPQGFNIVKSRLEYKLLITKDVAFGTQCIFSDSIKPTTADILFSNAYLSDTNGL